MKRPQKFALLLGLLAAMSWSQACDSEATLGTVSGSTSVPVVEGVLEVSVEALDFGVVCPGASAELEVVVRNTGEGAFPEVTASLDEVENSDFSLKEPLGSELAAGVEVTLTWIYEPTGEGADTAVWAVTAGEQTVSVTLSGQQGGPEINAPERIDFGAAPVGETTERILVLYNSGEEPVVVGAIGFDPNDDVPSEGVAWLDLPELPISIEPTASVDLAMTYDPPSYAEPFEEPLGQVVVVSNDCVQPEFSVPVFGWPGGVDLTCPDPPVVTEDFTGKDVDVTDVLFVVDNSESMQAEQAQLADNFGAFISAAEALGTDYRIGVTTTDAEAHEGALQGTPSIVTSANQDDFLTNIQVGSGGNKTEKGLLAAQPSLASASGFAPHVRPQAILVIIFVSDEPDSSPGTANTYLESYRSMKPGAPERVIVHAIVGPPKEEGCDGAEYGPAYSWVAEESGGIVASICEPSFADALVAFGEASFAARTRFKLEFAAVPGTVSVVVGGVACDEGWALDPDGQTVRFSLDSPCLPAGGQPLQITYEMICLEDEVAAEP